MSVGYWQIWLFSQICKTPQMAESFPGRQPNAAESPGTFENGQNHERTKSHVWEHLLPFSVQRSVVINDSMNVPADFALAQRSKCDSVLRFRGEVHKSHDHEAILGETTSSLL